VLQTLTIRYLSVILLTLAIGLVYRLTRNIRRSGLASASRTRVVEGEYRVVGKPVLPSV